MKFPTIITLPTTRTSFPLNRYWLFMLLSSALFLNTNFTLAFANTDLSPFVAEYKAENDYVTGGKATLSLRQNKTGSYDFVLQTKPTGIFKLTGKGNIREHAVLPSLQAPFESSSFRYTDKGDSRRNYHIEFDRANGKFQLMRQAQTMTHPLPAGTLDRLSVTLAILNQLKNNTDFTKLDVNILNGTESQKITFTNRGTEQIATSIGTVSALRIRKERESSNRKTIIWLTRMKNTDLFIPAKIEQFKHEKLTMRLILTNFSTIE